MSALTTSRSDALQQRYRALVHSVMEKGEHFRKAHGEWVRLRLDDDPNGMFIELDTWNYVLNLKRGSGFYNYHGGFEPRDFFEHLGIDFGGFTLYITEARLAAYERVVAAL